MKRNKMMRAASAMLISVLLTTSIISGTFAKYTSSSTGSDSARIAKWGIAMPASLVIDLFDADYDGTVTSADSTNVVAPGTSKTATISLVTVTGAAPEVDYKLAVTLEATTSSTTIAKLDSLDGFKWTLKKPGVATATEYSTFADLKTAVEGMSVATVEANNLPTGWATGANTVDIGWKWDFETADDAATAAVNEAEVRDTADTAAGDAAAAGSLDTFTITLTVSATQID